VRIALSPSHSTPDALRDAAVELLETMAGPTERRSASLSSRVVAGSAVLALLVAVAFGVLVYAVTTLDDATKRERHAKAVTAQTLQLEKLVLDLDTGLRGFVLSGKNDLLKPWTRRSPRSAR